MKPSCNAFYDSYGTLLARSFGLVLRPILSYTIAIASDGDTAGWMHDPWDRRVRIPERASENRRRTRSEDATLRLCEPARRAVLGADRFRGRSC
jgi:hypothetical protein